MGDEGWGCLVDVFVAYLFVVLRNVMLVLTRQKPLMCEKLLFFLW